MSDAIIKVEGVGKKYIISHEQAAGYTALRDVISNKAKAMIKAKKNSLPAKEEFWALKDLNFEIKQGEAVGIIGRNGAGKSTLLKILSRITEPTTGRIELNGRVASLLEVGTGFHPELTGRENIFLNGAILGMSRAEMKRKFDEIVDFSGVEKFLDTPVKRYSSGMYVRLAFSIAAHLEPEILVVDEVLAVGDSEFQKKCLGKMKEVTNKEGRTVLFVSHDITAIEFLCDTAIYLRNGEVKSYNHSYIITTEYLKDNRESMKLKNSISLSEGVLLKSINVNNLISSGDPLPFEITIECSCSTPPRISEFCLLFYNSRGQRVAILDLRDYLYIFKCVENQIEFNGVIRNFNLVEGDYFVGLYYTLNNTSKDIFEITQVSVKANIDKSKSKPYEAQYRGFAELELIH